MGSKRGAKENSLAKVGAPSEGQKQGRNEIQRNWDFIKALLGKQSWRLLKGNTL